MHAGVLAGILVSHCCLRRGVQPRGSPLDSLGYLRKLSRSDHPLKSFDALLGLVAIGLDRPDAARGITTEIEFIGVSKVRDRSWINLLDPMFRSAIETLKEPHLAEKRFDRLTCAAAAVKLAHPKLLGFDALGGVDTYRIQRTMAARVTTAR